jgi:hypothetical protein
VAAVGTHELAVQPKHLRAAQLALFTRSFQRLGGLCGFLIHISSIRASLDDDIGESSLRAVLNLDDVVGVFEPLVLQNG